MSGSAHHESAEGGTHANPVKLAIAIGVGTVALIIGIILLVQLAIGFYGSRATKDDPAMSEAAIAKRIAPAARVAVDPNAPPAAAAPAPAAPALPATTPAKAAAADGKATYDTVCAVCHAAGVANAPKPGDKAAWAARAKAGKQALYNSVLVGKGAMPPKGGNPGLSDEAIRAAVDYLLATAK